MSRNIFEVLNSLKASLGELESVLAPLAAISGQGRPTRQRRRARRVVRAAVAGAAVRRAAKVPRPATAARKATQVLQGRYLAAIRPLSKADRAKVKKVLQLKGKLAAISQAKKLHS